MAEVASFRLAVDKASVMCEKLHHMHKNLFVCQDIFLIYHQYTFQWCNRWFKAVFILNLSELFKILSLASAIIKSIHGLEWPGFDLQIIKKLGFKTNLQLYCKAKLICRITLLTDITVFIWCLSLYSRLCLFEYISHLLA